MLLPSPKVIVVILLMMTTPSVRKQNMTASEIQQVNSEKSPCGQNPCKIRKDLSTVSVPVLFDAMKIKTFRNRNTGVWKIRKGKFTKLTQIYNISRTCRTIQVKMASTETSNMGTKEEKTIGRFSIGGEIRKEMNRINKKGTDIWYPELRSNQEEIDISITKLRRRLLSETSSLPSQVMVHEKTDSSKIPTRSTNPKNPIVTHPLPIGKETIPVKHIPNEESSERISDLTPFRETVTDNEELSNDETILQRLDEILREIGVPESLTPSLESVDSKYGRTEIWLETNVLYDTSVRGKSAKMIGSDTEKTPIISREKSQGSETTRKTTTDKKYSSKNGVSRAGAQQKISRTMETMLSAAERGEDQRSKRVKRDNSVLMQETTVDEIVEDLWGQAPLEEVEEEYKMEDEEEEKDYWSLDFRASLVDAVADHFYSQCVFFVYDPESLRDAGDAVALWQRVGADSGRGGKGLPYPEALTAPLSGGATALPHPPLRLPACPPGRPLVVVTSATAARALARFQRRWPGEARWLLLLAGASVARALPVLRGARLPPDCEVLLANEKGAAGGTVLLREVVRSRPQAPLQLQAWGQWQPPGRLQGPTVPLLERRADLHGTTLTVAAATCPPLERVVPLERALPLERASPLELESPSGGGTLALTGLFPAMWRELQRGLNASARVVRFPDEAYGRDANGSWTGIVGAAQRGRVNVAINSFLMSGARMKVVDFTMPVVIARAGVFVREPSDAPMRWELMASPFTRRLWLCVGAALVLLAAALAVVSRVTAAAPAPAAAAPAPSVSSPRTRRDAYAFAKRPAYASPRDTPSAPAAPGAPAAPAVRRAALSASDAMLLALGAVCNQGPEQSLTSHAGQLLTWVLHALAVVVIAAYSANLMASLTLRRAELPFQDLKGLVDHGGYALGVISGLIRNFMDASDPLLRRVYAQLLHPALDVQPKSFGKGFKRVCRGRYAFMTGTHTASGHGASCNFAVLPRGSFPLALAMVLPQGSPLRRILNFRLESMRRSGVLRRLFLRDWPSLQPSDEARFFPVALRSVTPVLVGLGAAVAASLLLLTLVERRTARRCVRSRPRPCCSPRPRPRTRPRRSSRSGSQRNAISSSVPTSAEVSGFFHRDELKPRSPSPARHCDVWL